MREAEEIKKYEEDFKWLMQNMPYLQEKYSSHYIAVLNKKVICANKDFKQVLKCVDGLSDNEKSRVIIEYIFPKDTILIP